MEGLEASQRRRVEVYCGVKVDQRRSSFQEPLDDGADDGQGEQDEDQSQGLEGSSTKRTKTIPAKPLAKK